MSASLRTLAQCQSPTADASAADDGSKARALDEDSAELSLIRGH
jgi:hypothetical protein